MSMAFTFTISIISVLEEVGWHFVPVPKMKLDLAIVVDVEIFVSFVDDFDVDVGHVGTSVSAFSLKKHPI